MRKATCAGCGKEWDPPLSMASLPADWPLMCRDCVERTSSEGRRVEAEEHCGQCGAVVEGCHACQGVPE